MTIKKIIPLIFCLSLISLVGCTNNTQQDDPDDEPKLQNKDGFCDTTVKRIVIRTDYNNDSDTVEDIEYYIAKVIRHEIIHAFLYESGLSCNSWGENEEIVDWFAIQFEKITNEIDKILVETNYNNGA